LRERQPLLGLRRLTIETLGRGSHFGQVPLKQAGRVYWFATRNLPQGNDRSRTNCKDDLLAIFRRWHKPILKLIEATEESVIIRTEIYDRRRLKALERAESDTAGRRSFFIRATGQSSRGRIIDDKGRILTRRLAVE